MKKPAAVISPRRNLSTFKASHDPETIIPNRIKAALEKLRKDHGDEAYAYENANPADDDGTIMPFSKLASVSAALLNKYRSQFADFVVDVKQDMGSHRAPRKVWFATVKAAKAAREA